MNDSRAWKEAGRNFGLKVGDKFYRRRLENVEIERGIPPNSTIGYGERRDRARV